jgi:hypothetical protein
MNFARPKLGRAEGTPCPLYSAAGPVAQSAVFGRASLSRYNLRKVMTPRTLGFIIAAAVAYLAAVASAGLYIATSIVGRATVYTVALVALWAVAVVYSRRRWPRIGCRTCGGDGKHFEPLAFRIVCFRWRRRAWRPCDACDGSAWKLRPQGLGLRAR